MGILDLVLGNASNVKAESAESKFEDILVEGEQVEFAYQLVRDYILFTNKRFVLIDKQGVTGAKVEYQSYPYKSVSHFTMETAGTLDLEGSIKIWITNLDTPIYREFHDKVSLFEVQAALATYVCK